MASIIDAVLAKFIALNNFVGVWDNSTAYTVGQRVTDDVDGNIYQCVIAHTSSATGTFAAYRAANTNTWINATTPERFRGTWATGTAYVVRDFVVDNGRYAVCISTHTSGASFNADSTRWTVLIDVSLASFPDPPVASSMIVRDAANTIYEAKTFAQVRTLLALNEYATITPTTAGLAILDDADNVAQRTTLGTFSNAQTANKTASYPFTAADCGKVVPVDSSGAAYTQTLTAAATVGAGFVIGFQKIDTTYNPVTIDGNAAETINGAATIQLNHQYETVWLMCDGSNWSIISGRTNGAFKLIDRRVPAGTSTFNFVLGVSLDYGLEYRFRFMGLEGSVDDAGFNIKVSQDGGSTWLGGTGYKGASVSSVSDSATITSGGNNGSAQVGCSGGWGTSPMRTMSGEVMIDIPEDPASAVNPFRFNFRSTTSIDASTFKQHHGGGDNIAINVAQGVTGFQLITSSGNVDNGLIELFRRDR